MRVLLNMTDDVAEPSFALNDEASNGASDQPSRPSTPPLATALKEFMRFADKYSNRAKRVEAAKFGASSSAALARLLLLSPDPKTPFKGDLGVRKHCTWTKPIPLADVKAVGRVTGGTVNDVLLSAVSGALGRYMHHRGEPAGGIDIRAVVPVNLRPAEEELKLGNAFGLIFLSLPIGISDPLDRLEELKRRMDSIKGTPEAIVAFGILTAIGAATPEVEDIVVSLFGKKATTIITNVPGPREVRYLAGRPIRGLMFWVPQSARLGLGVSILSYAGEVLVGIASDAGLVPDPETIVQGVHQEFEGLMDLVTMAREADAEMATNL
jgi:WS/DGAT/MGAT family acyltransferase